MKKKIISAIFMYFIFLPIFAHSPLLIIEESDGIFVYLKAGFSNGQNASGSPLYVKSLFDNREIEKLTFPESSTLSVKIPQEPYYLVFDGGPGHKISKAGPPPENGFTIHSEAENNKIKRQGIPLWMLITVIAALITAAFFIQQKLSS